MGDRKQGNHELANVETIFHLAKDMHPFLLPCDYMDSLGKRNFLISHEWNYHKLSHSSLRSVRFDAVYLASLKDDELDAKEIQLFVKSHLTNPKTTRFIYWSDGDIKLASQLQELFGIPGESTEDSMILLDKYQTKSYLREAGLKYADFYHFSNVKEENIESLVEAIETKHNKKYPLFGKPTSLCHSAGTEVIKDQRDLIDYLKYAMKNPDLEFLIESYLDGKHCCIEGVVIDNKIVYDYAVYYPNELRAALFGIPWGMYIVPFESEIYQKAHIAFEKFVQVLPHCQNTAIWVEFVLMDGEPYIMEACKRLNGSICPAFTSFALGINFEEIRAKLQVGRFDFYLPLPRTIRNHSGCVRYKILGKLATRKNPLPQISSQVCLECDDITIGEPVPVPGVKGLVYPSYSIFIEGPNDQAVGNDIHTLLDWHPFEYADAK